MLLLSEFWCLAALELMLWLITSLAVRRFVAIVLWPSIFLISGMLLLLWPSWAMVLVCLASAYRLVNLLRLAKARIHEHHLKRMSVQASLWLVAWQAVLSAAWMLSARFAFLRWDWGVIMPFGVAVAVAILAGWTLRNLLKTRTPKFDLSKVSDAHLPTLTVAIPARNETDDLELCLQSLVASDYPKLEILVLDDCSQNKRTPEIIRNFAHAGVRFLQGHVPEDNWLAKNQAYQQLYEEANGELILFCGVDVRFAPSSLRMLVAALEHKHKSMVSIIPKNALPSPFGLHTSSLIQPMRYAWELAVPRRLFRSPPVLSTCWLIKRDVLASAGGFAAVSRSVLPEGYFARVSAVHDGYSFMQSSDRMGIVSAKSVAEQRATAVRTLYPRVHKRIEVVLAVSMLETLVCVAPYIWLAIDLLAHAPWQTLLLPLSSVVLLTVIYAAVVSLTYRLWLARSLVLLPIAAVLDVILLNYSMIRYEFFDVIWKDRNVCVPVMRVVDPAAAPFNKR